MSKPTFTFTLFDASDTEVTISLPAKFVVCPRCQGTGSHVNPSIDGHGLTREDFDQDPDFAEGYFRGDYDIPCATCHGERVVSVIDHERLNAEQRAQWDEHLAQEEAYRRDYDSERWLRMAEAGERW